MQLLRLWGVTLISGMLVVGMGMLHGALNSIIIFALGAFP